MSLPLNDVTVISIEQAIAAPYCSRLLADLGARVIKVERPDGGDFARKYDTRARGLSSHFVWTNRSKESLALDLKDVGAVAALKKLISKSDVFGGHKTRRTTVAASDPCPTLARLSVALGHRR